MSVLRKEKKGNFTVIDNAIFKDYDLSLKATGLLCKMLSLPDNWEYSVKGLSKITSDGISSITSGLKELTDAGYFRREQRYKDGKFAGYDYIISETKKCDFPFSENPITENTLTENHAQLNTNKSNTEKLNTYSIKGCSSVLAMMTEEEASRLFSIYEDADLLIDVIDEELNLKNKFGEIENAYRYVIGYAENKKWLRSQTQMKSASQG